MGRFDSRNVLAIVSLLAVAIAAACAQAGSLRVAGVAPNLLLVTLVVLSFFSENPAFYGLLLFFAVLMGRAMPVIFDPVVVVTAFLALLVFWLQRRFVWPDLIGVIITITITTVLTYVIISPGFLIRQPNVILYELVYNVGVGLLLFEILRFFFGRRVR